MIKTVMVVSAQNKVGNGICADFKLRGCRVLQGIVGDRGATVEGKDICSIDPTSDISIKEAVNRFDCAVDMLVINLDYIPEGSCDDITAGQNYDLLLAAYNYNAVGPVRIIKAFLPLLEKGSGKRISVITTVESSNNACYDTANYLNHTSKSALNMAMNILFNDLRAKGYTFRLYCRSISEPAESIEKFAAEYFLRDRSYDKDHPKHSDEDRLVLRNWEGREIPW